MIKQTTDYDIFKKHPSNVPLQEFNLKKIINSIKIKNLLKFRPILVDREFQVIDGQHRLEAAKQLGIAVFYEQQEDLITEDMRLLNQNMRVWKNREFLQHFVQEGKEEYIKFQRFVDKTGLNIECALQVLGYSKGGGKRDKSTSQLFKEGKFIFPSEQKELFGYQLVQNLRVFSDYVISKTVGAKGYLGRLALIHAFYIFFSCPEAEFPLFMKKLEYKLNLLRCCSRVVDYLSILQEIYNYRNPNPIDVRDIV